MNPECQAYRLPGYDPTYFCPDAGCTDNDGDGFAVEGGNCVALDCDDSNAGIKTSADEVCDDNECRRSLWCVNIGVAEVCDDAIDNDGDNKADCADQKDCDKDPVCK